MDLSQVPRLGTERAAPLAANEGLVDSCRPQATLSPRSLVLRMCFARCLANFCGTTWSRRTVILTLPQEAPMFSVTAWNSTFCDRCVRSARHGTSLAASVAQLSTTTSRLRLPSNCPATCTGQCLCNDTMQQDPDRD